MVFGDFFNELLGSSCVMFVVIVWLIGWAVSSMCKAAGNALKNEHVQEGVKTGLWWWFFSDD